MDKLAYMIPPYESEIRARIAETLGCALGQAPKARSIHMPARDAHASVRPPQGGNATTLLALDYSLLYGATLVESVRERNGWLLLDFSPAFFSALVERINASTPAPDAGSETYAQNRMRTLSRHGGTGCPNVPSFYRALLLALRAHESVAAYQKAERAALTLFHEIPPRERPALLGQCGGFGGALLRLLNPEINTAHVL
ncbi:MAG: hypothetical protein PHW41_02870 [Eubacteriales bacterium]|nr:hypothetical protein [Eubacteriales bacterium]